MIYGSRIMQCSMLKRELLCIFALLMFSGCPFTKIFAFCHLYFDMDTVRASCIF